MNLVLNEEQAEEQLRVLLSATWHLSDPWNPLSCVSDDYEILGWVRDPDNEWCSGKKADFEFLLGKAIDYQRGDYARAVLKVLGIYVK